MRHHKNGKQFVPARGSDVDDRTNRHRSVLSALLGVLAMCVVAGVLVSVAVTPIVAVSGVATSSAINVFESLPAHLDPGQLAEPSTIYAKQGDENVEVATFYSQDRETVEWDQISQYVKDAAVAEEDPRFYTHGGVDVLATGRAVVQNATGQNLSGASTITMQYVRNVLVQEAESIVDEEEREAAYKDAMRQEMDRKLKEMRYAVSIEKQYSKDEILLGYLNISLFGRQIYGIESAARYYYGKSAKDVTLAEAASLVATVNNPSKMQIDLPENIERNKERRNKILGSMLNHGKITQEQYDEAVATEVAPNITPRPAGCDVAETRMNLGYFCDYVQRYILNDPSFGNTAEERFFNFQRGGYSIYTTIDLDLQNAGVEAMRASVPAVMEGIDIGGSAVSVEPGTGRVLAMVQNRTFTADPEVAKNDAQYTAINYNTDFEYGGSSGFQVGSTFKAFTLAEWIRTGHSIKQMVDTNGRTEQYQSFPARCLDGGIYGYGSWTFQNDSGIQHGTRSVEYTIEQSVNGGTVSMQQQLDLCDTFDTAQKLGMHRATEQESDESQSNYGTRDLAILPSTVYSGTDEVAPITVATAFAAFGHGGETCTPVPIDSITGPDGEDVAFTGTKCTSGVSPDVAAGVTHVLQNTVNRGIADHARSAIGVPHYAKTGTTDDVVDNWTVGGSSKVSTAVWVGNVTGKVSTMNFGGYSGLMTADQAIWPAIMNVADQKYGGDPFPDPGDATLRVTTQEVPATKGKSFDDAKQLLEELGFSVSEGSEADSSVEKDLVAGTSPEGGSNAPVGSSVQIHRSNGSMSELPDVVGTLGNEALAELNSAGFHSITLPGECRREEITSMTPEGGSEAKRSNAVTLSCE